MDVDCNLTGAQMFLVIFLLESNNRYSWVMCHLQNVLWSFKLDRFRHARFLIKIYAHKKHTTGWVVAPLTYECAKLLSSSYTEKQGRPESQYWLIYRAFMTMNKFKYWRVKILEYRYEISNTMLNVSISISNSFRIVMCLFYV